MNRPVLHDPQSSDLPAPRLDEEIAIRPRVLIVDDDPGIVDFLGARCARLGCEVHTASQGLHALVMARRMKPDVLIVDVNLPEIDGLSLCFHLLTPEGKALDVIVVTGRSDEETIERCDSFGATLVRKGPTLWPEVRAALAGRFPRLASEPDHANRSEIGASVLDTPRILIVDDDADVGRFLESRLRKLGLEPIIARSGSEGYRLALRNKPSVILSDCYMLDGDISYLIARLRANPVTERIPVVAMSARKLVELEKSQLLKDVLGRQGPVRLLHKPLELSHLMEAVSQFVAVGR